MWLKAMEGVMAKWLTIKPKAQSMATQLFVVVMVASLVELYFRQELTAIMYAIKTKWTFTNKNSLMTSVETTQVPPKMGNL
jgi:hypothetical protein